MTFRKRRVEGVCAHVYDNGLGSRCGFSAEMRMEENWAYANTTTFARCEGSGEVVAQKALQDKNVHAMKMFGLFVRSVFSSKFRVSGLKVRCLQKRKLRFNFSIFSKLRSADGQCQQIPLWKWKDLKVVSVMTCGPSLDNLAPTPVLKMKASQLKSLLPEQHRSSS